MAKTKTHKSLKKELTFFNVFAIAAGSTLAGGFFILPGLAAAAAGESFAVAYVLAAILLIPSIMSNIELSTAMPRAGGVYYFLDRSMGPMIGTIGGLGVWLVLILKVCFALIGISAYVSLFFAELQIEPIAIALAVVLGVLNLFGAKKSGRLQDIIVSITLIILVFFIGAGLPEISIAKMSNVFVLDTDTLFPTVGLVFVSYIGVTKVASLSEEIQHPEKNIPRSMFWATGVAFVVYLLGTIVMVGLVPIDKLSGSLTPAALAIDAAVGRVGVLIISIGALMAFTSVANAGILSASRYPLAMSRDHIVPTFFRKINKFGSPSVAVITTTIIIIVALLSFDAMKIAKLASAFQLLIFAFLSLAVIVMRESKIDSYDPGYKSPFYPYMQIAGIGFSLWLIVELGLMTTLFSAGLILIGILWYVYYAKSRVIRNGAIYHMFERLGRQRYEGLDTELRGILKEKGLRKGDPFDDIVLKSKVLQFRKEMDFEAVVDKTADWLEKILPITKDQVIKQIMDGTRIGATPVTHGVALPHFRVDGIDHAEMVLVRCNAGINVTIYSPLTQEEEGREIVTAIFFLISPEKDPTQHLRILAQIAGRVDDESFIEEWKDAKDEMELKETLLHDESFYSLCISHSGNSAALIGKALYEIKFPENCLVALLRRDTEIIVPKGKTILEEGDRLTILGETASISELKNMYS